MEKWFLLLIGVFGGINCFNVDVSSGSITKFENNVSDSHFGYSVALRQTTGNKKIMIGSPLYKVNGRKAGRLYSCEVTGVCQEKSDKKPLGNPSSRQLEGRTRQTFGMSITTVGETVLATAPRWVYYDSNNFQTAHNYYRGRTVAYKDAGLDYWYDLIPCQNERVGNLYYGYCLAGMSSTGYDISDDPLFIVGAPGSENTQGALFSFFKRKDSTYSPLIFKTNSDRLTPNSLMGYSVSAGKFTDTKQKDYLIDVAGGAPRSEGLSGKVIIYTLTSRKKAVIAENIANPHDQIGSYFGASVLAIDVNNDGIDDLLVGSPKYYFNEDEGIVDVFLNRPTRNGLDHMKESLVGEKTIRAQFGSSLADIGDINKDGYKDVAIGAPYGGPDGNGAVYIYKGGKTGILKIGSKGYSQVIYAKDMPDIGSGFGISVAGNVDVDNNGYPDMIVGAYKASKAYLLRTKPVITLTSTVRTSVNAVPARQSDTFRCDPPFSTNYNCIKLFVDLTYSGESTPDSLGFEITLECDQKKTAGKRAFVSDKQKTSITKTVILEKGKQKSFNFTIGVILALSTDVVSPIAFAASYKAIIDPSNCMGNKLCPVQDQLSTAADSHEITYLKECASETTCKPNLVVNASVTLPKRPDESIILYGRVYEVDVVAKVENLGESAYQSIMKLNFTSDLAVSSVHINKKAYPLWDAVPLTSSIKQLSFPLGNPISSNDTVEVLVKFSVYKPRPSSSSYTFSMQASAFGEDTDETNNKASVKIDTKIEYCVNVQSDAKPALVRYRPDLPKPPEPSKNNSLNDSVYVDVVGSPVNYTFYVQNSGKLPVERLEASIEVVVEKSGFDFIYVVDLLADGDKCAGNDLNTLNYKLPFVDYNVSTPTNTTQRIRKDGGLASCRSASCKKYTCDISKITPSNGVTLTMVTRLWDYNLPKINVDSVKMEIKIDLVGSEKDWYVPKTGCDTSSTATLELGLTQKKTESKTKWWIYLLASLGALILLAVTIAILYKIGFFKRKRTAKNITGPNDLGNEATNPNNEDEDDDDE